MPASTDLTQRLLDCGFSPALIRRLGEGLPMDVADEAVWAGAVLERNLHTDDGAALPTTSNGPHDGHVDNAYMDTPPDGTSPTMAMVAACSISPTPGPVNVAPTTTRRVSSTTSWPVPWMPRP